MLLNLPFWHQGMGILWSGHHRHTHWFSKALVPTWDMQVVFGQVCVQVNVSAEIFRFPYGSRWLLAEGNHFEFVALQFFFTNDQWNAMEWMWSSLVPELNLGLRSSCNWLIFLLLAWHAMLRDLSKLLISFLLLSRILEKFCSDICVPVFNSFKFYINPEMLGFRAF